MARTLFALLLVCLMLHANAQTSSEKKSVINMEKKTIKQDAGRKQLGDFAPKFAELNDDVLFGQVWNRQDELSLRDRSLITVVALVSMGMTDDYPIAITEGSNMVRIGSYIFGPRQY